MILSLCVAAFWISLACFVSVAALQSEPVRSALVLCWYSVASIAPESRKESSIRVAGLAIQAIYMRDGEISHRKLAVIAVTMNLFAAAALILGVIASPDVDLGEDMEEFSYPLLFLLGTMGVYLAEYYSIRTFLRYYERVMARNRTRYLLVSSATILAVVFVMFPVVVLVAARIGFPGNEDATVYAIALTQWWSLSAVIMPMMSEVPSHYGWLAIPAAISVFVPVMIVMLFITVSRSPFLLERTARLLDVLSVRRALHLRNFFFGAIGVFGSVVSVLPTGV